MLADNALSFFVDDQQALCIRCEKTQCSCKFAIVAVRWSIAIHNVDHVNVVTGLANIIRTNFTCPELAAAQGAKVEQ